MPLLVKKVDGQHEPYIHTRVMATIAVSTADAGCYDEQTVNALADAIRMHIEDCKNDNNPSIVVPTDEIYSMILAVLQETGMIRAADSLKRHRVQRSINRSRQLVLHCLRSHLSESEQEEYLDQCCATKKEYYVCDEDCCPCHALEPWNKSRLTHSLLKNYKMSNAAARMLAGNIENKVFALTMSVVRSELIQQLVYNEFYYIRKNDLFFEPNHSICKPVQTEIHEIKTSNTSVSSYDSIK